MAMFQRTQIKASKDFARIASLRRRVWGVGQMEACAEHYSNLLRTHTGTMSLRPLQAASLHEIATYGGLFGPIAVGGGKTLLSLLAPRVLGSVRPMLLLPASLIEKTRRDWRALANHWQIPQGIQIQSYETLGREGASKFLESTRPDLIVADEAHRLKNLKAGVTRRVARYMHAHPSTAFVAISGTLLKDDIEDFAHLLIWSLKLGAPVPLEKGELSEWSECLGTKARNPLHVVEPGPLLQFALPADRDGDEKATARRAFRRLLRDTPGVIASGEEQIGCSIYISAVSYAPNNATETNFRTLREQWETPDGWALTQAVDVWRHARELALGFHYVWDPRPPPEWLEARRQWAKFVRDVLSRSKSLDTELQVRNAALAGAIDRSLWDAWAAVKDSFAIQSKAVWHDFGALQLATEWAKQGPGIIWTEHSFFARELARVSGLHYYGEQGLRDGDGAPIEQASPLTCIIASARANSTGRNLQAWNRNLITSPPAGAPAWEQLLGRTHRQGQTADTVTCDVMVTCREHFDAFERARELARASEQTMGHAQKLLIADITFPSEMEVTQAARSLIRWDKSNG